MKKTKFSEEVLRRISGNLRPMGSHISCGINEVQSVGNAYTASKPRNMTRATYDKHFREALERQKEDFAFVVVSVPRINSNSTLIKCLDKLKCTKSRWRVNPNSDNAIKVWTI